MKPLAYLNHLFLSNHKDSTRRDFISSLGLLWALNIPGLLVAAIQSLRYIVIGHDLTNPYFLSFTNSFGSVFAIQPWNCLLLIGCFLVSGSSDKAALLSFSRWIKSIGMYVFFRLIFFLLIGGMHLVSLSEQSKGVALITEQTSFFAVQIIVVLLLSCIGVYALVTVYRHRSSGSQRDSKGRISRGMCRYSYTVAISLYSLILVISVVVSLFFMQGFFQMLLALIIFSAPLRFIIPTFLLVPLLVFSILRIIDTGRWKFFLLLHALNFLVGVLSFLCFISGSLFLSQAGIVLLQAALYMCVLIMALLYTMPSCGQDAQE